MSSMSKFIALACVALLNGYNTVAAEQLDLSNLTYDENTKQLQNLDGEECEECKLLGEGAYGAVFIVTPKQVPGLPLPYTGEKKLVGKVLKKKPFCKEEGPIVFGKPAEALCQEGEDQANFQKKILPNPVSDWEQAPDVVQYFGYGRMNEDWVMVVMEKAGDKDLSKYIQDARNSNDQEMPYGRKMQNAITIMKGIYNGLNAMHFNGYKWRDLKPANVMITVDKDDVVGVRLVDLGTLVPLDDLGSAGTAVYMPFPKKGKNGRKSRESFSRQHTWDSESSNSVNTDLFALGAVGWDLFVSATEPVSQKSPNWVLAYKILKKGGILGKLDEYAANNTFADAVRDLIAIKPENDGFVVGKRFMVKLNAAQMEVEMAQRQFKPAQLRRRQNLLHRGTSIGPLSSQGAQLFREAHQPGKVQRSHPVVQRPAPLQKQRREVFANKGRALLANALEY